MRWRHLPCRRGEQLYVWAERSGSPSHGGRPRRGGFDAISAAKARGMDIVFCDTAGGFNKQNLMNELAKSGALSPGAAGCRLRNAAGPGRHHGAERSHSGETVQRCCRNHRHCADKAGRHRQGRDNFRNLRWSDSRKIRGSREKADDLLPFNPREFVERCCS